jgi:hypothetical protein
MRKIVVGVTLGIVAVAISLMMSQLQSTAYGQRSVIPPNDGSEILLAQMGDKGMIVLVDTRQKVISSYRVDDQTGEISLRSVRNFAWDLMMDEFNGGAPKPKEIKALLEQR